MPSDDITRRIIEIIDLHVPDGEYNGTEITRRIHNHLAKEYPDLLERWLKEMEYTFIRDFIAKIRIGRRQVARKRARNLNFVEAAIRGANGEDYRPLLWDQPFVVNNEGLFKPLRLTSRNDNLYIATAYYQRAKHNRLNGIFHERIAAKLTGEQIVEDVFNPPDIDLLIAKIYEEPSQPQPQPQSQPKPQPQPQPQPGDST